MISLSSILKSVDVLQVIGSPEQQVTAIQLDSRKVTAGNCFIAIKGTASDGHSFIDTAIALGAGSIVCQTLPSAIHSAVTYVLVKDSARAAGQLAAAFFNFPSAHMKVTGVTGTNGKTSTVTLLFRLFRALGYHVGLLSTVQNQIDETVIPATHTTPDPVSLQGLLAQMRDAGCDYVFMEVSSHAADQQRIAGIEFAGAVFSNITHDHLDYHKTFEAYIRAKKSFFDHLDAGSFALVNADDRNASVMLQNTAAKKYTYALKTPADFKSKIIENTVAGLFLQIDHLEMHSRLIGEFNAYNLTAVYATACLLGAEKMEVLTILSNLMPPEGRFDQVVAPKSGLVGIVDYAHTPDALKNVLQTIQTVRTGNEQVITLVGCGGDRDAAKRPLMAEIACKYSNKVILTSDNPRSESPEAIIHEMEKGVPVTDKKKVMSITDRKQAIRSACMLGQQGDIILLAGKGHEKYQEINGVKHDFDDKAVLQEMFNELEK